jgi:hypothetical protein
LSKATRDVLAAQRAVDSLIGLEDFLRIHGEASFTFHHWTGFSYRGKEAPAPRSQEKAFDRWKTSMRLLGVGLKPDEDHTYRATADLSALITEAQARRDRLAEALQQLTGRAPRASKKSECPDPPHIRAVRIRLAMLEHDYVLSRASAALGVTPAKLRKEIRHHRLAGVEARIRRPGQRPRKITLGKLEPLVREGWSLADMADYLGVKNKSGVKKAIRVLGLEPSWKPAPNPRSPDLPREKVLALLADAKDRGLNKSALARTTKISPHCWKNLAAKHDLSLEWEELQTTNHRGKGEVLDQALTKGILEVAIDLGLSANAAAKKYGFTNACVLSRAAKRHGLDDLYQRVIGRGVTSSM